MTEWTIPVKSLDAVDVNGTGGAAGSTIDLGEVMSRHGCQVAIILASGQSEAFLNGSLDGTEWFNLDTYITPNGAPGGTYTARLGSDVPCRYIQGSAYQPVGTGTPSATFTTWHTSAP